MNIGAGEYPAHNKEIALIHSDPGYAESVKAVIEKSAHLTVSCYRSPVAFLRNPNFDRYDIVITQSHFPDHQHGMILLSDLSIIEDGPRLILLVTPSEVGSIKLAYRRGCSAVLTNTSEDDVIEEAITAVLEGECYIPDHLAQCIAGDSIFGGHGSDPIMRLDTREMELLTFLGDGMTEREIAKHWSCSLRLITYRKKDLKKKLGVTRLASLTKIALKHGLISIDDLP